MLITMIATIYINDTKVVVEGTPDEVTNVINKLLPSKTIPIHPNPDRIPIYPNPYVYPFILYTTTVSGNKDTVIE
jgi:hypothetical protein